MLDANNSLVTADNTDQISGETTVAIRFVQAGVRQVSLDLGQPMTVSAVTIDGAPVQSRHEGDRSADQTGCGGHDGYPDAFVHGLLLG